MSKPLSVTYRFTVEFTDNVIFNEPLLSKESAREVLWQVLYEGDKHADFYMDIIGEGEEV
jgi:hypothetical protein